ncbi:sigma-54 interaction domain-containing protein [Neobacillus citreus]|uniref:HTH-type transcriptional regulatory protein TyrR n=2 Tax=Neobacillus citreus TaxID=2833578 RepID=A0A9J6N3L9_9BACI|nr:sigma 54-interacting transcriptional regulator [Neobacillus citreus]MCH6267710.1 sigma 54-interacting transcriptional regulator [Neobacillus citreus]
MLPDASSELEKLKEIYETYQQMFQHSVTGVVITDKDGRITEVNPAFKEQTGLSASDVVGRRHRDLIIEEIIDQTAELQVFKEGNPITQLTKLYNGKEVLVTAIPIKNKQGQIIKVVSQMLDVTVLNQLKHEIFQLEQEHEEITQQLEELKSNKNAIHSIVAYDMKMKKVIDRALRVAQHDSTVILYGESGVGKEVVVKLIHENSNRSSQPLIKVNCGAIPNDLLESELFGYEPGAFTGASPKGKVGLFEQAAKGTILLDEIGEIPLHLQVKLLRVLQEFEITRVGGTKPIKIDTRVIAATNQNLEDLIKKGGFRKDLYYRLNIIPIHIPPLRERPNDIVPLTYHFIHNIRQKYGVNKIFSKEVLDSFQRYHWPGNVRELQNIVERLCIMIEKPIITAEDIRNELFIQQHNEKTQTEPQRESDNIITEPNNLKSLKEQMEHYEKQLIDRALKNYPSIRAAAKALDVDASTLSRKVQKYSNF